MIITRHPSVAAAYYALRMPVGTSVEYIGSIPEYHGHYTIEPCACYLCVQSLMKGEPGSRYQLTRDGEREEFPRHVRHTSVIPLGGEDPDSEAQLPVWASALVLKLRLYKAIPGISMDTKITEGSWEVHYSKAKPEEVLTVMSSLVHDYANGKFYPAPVEIPDGVGGHLRGRPSFSEIEVIRSPESYLPF